MGYRIDENAAIHKLIEFTVNASHNARGWMADDAKAAIELCKFLYGTDLVLRIVKEIDDVK